MTDQELRKLWRDAGGEFYGPRVETGSMPEAKLLPFLRALASQPSPAATVEINQFETTKAGIIDWKMEAERANRLLSAQSHSSAATERETALEAAALDFIAKVDRGEARSKHSYAAFKAALGIPAVPQTLPSREEIARILWERFAPVHHIGWADETHKAEYLAAADAVLSPLSRPKLCSHEAIIGLDGKWHCQRCGDAIEMSTASEVSSHHHSGASRD